MANTQGSGGAGWVVVLIAVHCSSVLAYAATLTVGGTQGWTTGVNYATWVAGQTFAPGDVLLFSYPVGAHDVVEVSKTGYDSCSATTALATHSDGNTSVPLPAAGSYYFLCSIPGHCGDGMKLAVTVGGAAATTPAPAPSTTVGTPPPTPANATAPVAAPPPAPVSATTPPTPVPSPVSAGTPVPSPVPAPAPASTPTLTPSTTPTPAPVSSAPSSTTTPASPPSPPSASFPPSPIAPTPPNSAPSLSSSTSFAAAVVVLGGAFLVL